jgi:beta-galactosidase
MSVPAVADTYLDTRGAQKGVVWINQRPLGRFWSIGPQYALYTPGPWLKKGRNDIIFFDLMGTYGDMLKSVIKPIYGATTSQRN